MKIVASSVLQKKLPTSLEWWATLDYFARAITAWVNSAIAVVMAIASSHLSKQVVWRFCRFALPNLVVASTADSRKTRCYYPHWS